MLLKRWKGRGGRDEMKARGGESSGREKERKEFVLRPRKQEKSAPMVAA